MIKNNPVFLHLKAIIGILLKCIKFCIYAGRGVAFELDLHMSSRMYFFITF